MIDLAVLGAPGSGKSAVAPRLREELQDRVILDWDAFMAPASQLAGREVRHSPRRWGPYRALVRAVVDQLEAVSVVLLTVCTPDELQGWPIRGWLLLDCADDERRRRVGGRLDPDGVEAAVIDAAAYRRLGLPALDTTQLGLDEVAATIARRLRTSA